jgi:hypothetical protein
VENATTIAFKGHLWHFSEHLTGLAFLDPHVDVNTKAAMVKNLKRSEKNIPPKRIESKAFNLGNPLESYVTRRTSRLFDLFIDTGTKRPRLPSRHHKTFGSWIQFISN